MPASTATIVGEAIVWSTKDVTYSGEITDAVTYDLECDVDEETKDGEGFTTTPIFSDHKHKFTVEIRCKSTSTYPTLGSAITIAGRSSCLVHKVSQKWAKKKVKMASIDGVYYPNVTVA